MNTTNCTGPIRRRDFLQAGMLTLGGIGLSDVLAAQAASGTERTDHAVILLYLHGGASQFETWDLKPNAPTDIRSVFNPIPTNVPGIDICEHFPLQAKIADKFSLIRSLHHNVGIHSDGGIVVLTGKVPSPLDPTSSSVSQHPDFGSVTSHLHGPHPDAVPRYIAMPRKLYMTRPAYLGMHYGPFELGNPAADSYKPPQLSLAGGRDIASLDDRHRLLRQFDRFRNDLDLNENLGGTEKFRDLAFRMLTSPRTAAAFDIAQEPDTLRDRYGRHEWGQSCLLARRLAQAGASVISLYINTPMPGAQFTNWDDHALNAGQPGHFGTFMERRLPYLDQCLTALIEDIFEQGLDKKIMVVVTGEFGRTPKIRDGNGSAGRDHWPDAYSALVSGGGLRMGQVVGATNSKAEFPTERPCSPQDLLATIYRHLGIDPNNSIVDFAGRPIPILPHGKPITELL